MLPVLSAFSIPPMRCSSPGVPGTAHARASVSGSRRYGRNSPSSPFGSVAKVTVRSGRSSTEGTCQRSAEGRTQRGADARDLVLGLEGAHAETLVLRELMQDVGGRRDRVRAQE